MRRSSLALLLPLLQGCSLIFVHGPPADHEQLRYFDCSSSAAAPVADASGAALNGLMAAILADTDPGEEASTSAVALFGTLAAVYAGSMIYGAVNGTDCGDAKQRLQQRIADRDMATAQELDALRRKLAAAQQGASATVPAPPVAPAEPASAPAEPTVPAPAPPPAPPPASAPPASPAAPAR